MVARGLPISLKTFAIAALLAGAAFMSGCVRRTLNITSEPPGALVYWNNVEIGRTPLKREFTWYGTYDVQVRKDGYLTLSTKTPVIAPWWQWPPFDLFAELWPGHIADERFISYTLQPASSDPPDPQVMMTHAIELKDQLLTSRYIAPATTRATSASTHPSAK